jgi:hypothetical protein
MRDLLRDGDILTIGSDHGPVDPDLKRRGSNDVFAGQPGLPGNETMVSLLLNLVAEGRLSLERLAEVASEAPAKLYGLYPRKGAIEIGSDADFTIVNVGDSWTITKDALIGKSGWTPFEGVQVQGRVRMTVIKGRVVACDGKLPANREPASFRARTNAGFHGEVGLAPCQLRSARIPPEKDVGRVARGADRSRPRCAPIRPPLQLVAALIPGMLFCRRPRQPAGHHHPFTALPATMRGQL